MATLLAPDFDIPAQLQTLTNLADDRIGAIILECSDDFFADAQRMLQFAAPVFVEDKFDNHGKWMDGWETRRKRHAGYDWAIVQLGVAGKIQALDVAQQRMAQGHVPAVQVFFQQHRQLDHFLREQLRG